jgi:putative intracellular protease/amidase
MQIVIPLFHGFTALDAVGPYEVLSRLPDASITFAAQEPGPVSTDTGTFAVVAPVALGDVAHPDIFVVPGGPGTRAMVRDKTLADWVRGAHETSTWTTSVCTGSLVLAGAGVLDGVEATTHWGAVDLLRSLGAIPVDERVVRVGKIVTAAGVSAGIDMALTLAALVAGDDVAKTIQLMIEYDPQPPFDSGSVSKADPKLVEGLRSLLAPLNRVSEPAD